MPENKDQHYLPKHYLRYFSTDGGKNIGIARITPFKFTVGPIKGQCQEDWFYRDDGQLDDWLKKTESEFGTILPQIIASRSMSDEQLIDCKFMAALFNIRTKKAAEIHGVLPRRIFFDVVNEGIRSGEVPPPPDDWSIETVGVKGVSGFLIKNVLFECFLEMGTLRCKLLEPAEKKRFITSDHPVVCMNQLFAKEAAVTQRSYSGFSRSGFQLILPICPTLCLLFYDPKVYKVGNRRDNIVSVNDEDVELLNSLQLQSAHKCLYTSELNSIQQMQILIEKFGKSRIATPDLLRISQINGSTESYHFRSPNPRKLGAWSFCKIQSNPRIPESRTRNPAWTEMVRSFIEHLNHTKTQNLMEEFKLFTEHYCAG